MTLDATPVERPHNTPGVVYSVTQDQQDYLWLAAEFEGLLRYDGQEYLRFMPPGPRRAVSFSQVVSDSQNQLWVGTWGNGLWRLDSRRREWQQINSALPADARIQSMLLGQNQMLWVGTTAGLFRLTTGSQQAELWQPLAGQRIWQLTEQDDGTLWVATSNGLYRQPADSTAKGEWLKQAEFRDKEIRTVAVQGQHLLVGQRAHLHLLDLSKPDQNQHIEFGNPNTILAESASSWLIGSIDGLFRLNLTGGKLTTELLQSAVDIRKIFRGRRGQIWLTSRNNGMQMMPAAAIRPIEPAISAFLNPKQPHRLGPASTTDTRWQALEKSLLQLHQGQWRELFFAAGNPVAYVRDVVQFGTYTLAATDQGLFQLNSNLQFVPVPLKINTARFNIERMVVAADGALWLGLWEQGVYRIDAAAATKPVSDWQAEQLQTDVQAQEGIVDIQTDAQQRLWLLSRQGKLYQGEADKITLRWQPDNKLATGYFQCMLPVEDMLWLCTDQGLIRLKQDLTTATLLGQAQGLPDPRVIGIARTEHFVWVLTRNGVLSFNPDGSNLHLLVARPGLDFSSAQLKGISPLTGNQVQLATSSGLWQLSQADMTQVPAAMQLHLTSMRLNRQLFHVAETDGSVLLPEQVDELQLQFKLLSFQPHLHVQYFFRWQNQQSWTALGEQAVLTLSQLRPGQHQLEVKAQAGGQIVQTRPLLLQVPVPLWQRPLGIVLLCLSAALTLGLLYHLRTRRLQQRAATLDRLVAQRTTELELANQQLKLLSNTDSLTGLLNRRALYAAAALLQAQRNRLPAALTLVLMDIDHFKKINDLHGHDTGDAVLKAVAAYLKQRLRGQDLIARWGGEEFLLLMPQTDLQQASRLVEELRLGIRQLQLPVLPAPLSATFGISAVAQQPDALEQAVKAADLALYQGKAQGRDRVVLATAVS